MVSAEFTAAAERVQALTTRPTNEELLELYGLYKQATMGDNDTARPAIFDLMGRYKWGAWKDLNGTSQEEAEKKYIELVDKIIARINSS